MLFRSESLLRVHSCGLLILDFSCQAATRSSSICILLHISWGRRIQVADTTRLPQLHDILQIGMGWTNSHLHQFVVDNQFYSDPAFELDDVANEQRISLQQLALQPKMRFGYEYDFGDY